MNKGQLHIVDGGKEYFIELPDILFCKSSGNYSDIYTTEHRIFKTIRIQIGQLFAKITEKGKMVEHHLERIGRSYIINMKYIQYVNPKKGVLILHTDKDVPLTIPKAAAKELVKLVGRKQEKQVVTVYADKRKLTIERRELNEDIAFERGRMYVDLRLIYFKNGRIKICCIFKSQHSASRILRIRTSGSTRNYTEVPKRKFSYRRIY